MDTKQVIGGAARGAVHMISDEAREKLTPLKQHLLDGSAEVQSRAGRQILRLAEQIRELGARLERGREAQTVARRLEETADYLRFRPVDGIARDAAKIIRKNHVVPIAVGLAGAVLAYKLIALRCRDTED